MKIENPNTGLAYKNAINKVYGNNIQTWTDSLGIGLAAKIEPLLDSRTVDENSFGGKTSSYIRDQFITNADIEKTQIFWVGRNNGGFIDAIIDDLRAMINHLGHSNFLILTVPNGGSESDLSSGSNYWIYTQLEELLQSEYPNNFLNNRKASIYGWNMGDIRLIDSFTQPAINSNIQINVTDTSFLSTTNSSDSALYPQWDNKIRIGLMNECDMYEIVSVDSATLMTVKLLESNRITEGGLVENPDDGAGATQYLRVIQELDYQMYQNDTTLSTFRADLVHETSDGQQLIAELIAKFLNSRFI